jgi:hypothetical protein
MNNKNILSGNLLKNVSYGLLAILLSAFSCAAEKSAPTSKTRNLRAPAFPLVTIDPYTSAWSNADQLFDGEVCHWTGKRHGLIGAIRVDGKTYRFLGKEDVPKNALLPMADAGGWNGKYVRNEPAEGWKNPGFDDKSWTDGKGAFGTKGQAVLGTLWETKDIWVRREFTLDSPLSAQKIILMYSHDDIFELFLNGKKIVETGFSWFNNVVLVLDDGLRKLLIPGGKNVIAVHCRNKAGGGYVDFGLYQENEKGEIFPQTAVQKSVALSATQTHYEFACGPVDLKLNFVSPLLTDRLEILSRPVNYVNYTVSSTDGAKHDVQIYFEATPEWAVHNILQEVTLEKTQTDGLTCLKTGTVQQPVLEKKGDNVRIDWGYFYLCGKTSANRSYALGGYQEAKSQFARNGKLDQNGTDKMNAKMNEAMPVLACTEAMGQVTAKPVSGTVMLAYDDLYSIQYFQENLMPWWKEDGKVTIADALKAADKDQNDIMKKCNEFDSRLWDEAMQAGGQNYAELCVAAYRQSIAAHKLLKDKQGNILFLSKENFSNGSIGTVDVTYPSAPLFLHYNPDLLKGMMNPIFYYSESGKWNKPFAAHDVGTYPKANGQTYGGDMPVEESGNMLILTGAIAHKEGNANYAKQHWNVLTTWANYLLQNGLDPENQLCTDDFAGHFAHNANLSVKAIMGIACYGQLAQMLGKTDIAQIYTAKAREMAVQWEKMANDGDHYRLTFDQPRTWSQKYNLVWDKLLDLNIFPKEVAQKEVAYYLTKQNKYGLPLDNRKTYTKADWIVWTATLANDAESFQKLIAPVHLFVNETPSRVPMTDWYETTDAKQVGFQARSVVGGYFIKMLENKK